MKIKNRKLRLLAIILAFTMVFAMAPPMTAIRPNAEGSNYTVYASDAKDVSDAINAYTKALEQFVDTEHKEDLTNLVKALSHLDSITSIASGSIALLEVMGIIEDPTTAMLSKILDSVKAIEDKLADVDLEIKDIMNELQGMKIDGAAKQRYDNATLYQGRWNDFETGPLELVKEDLRHYQAYLENGKKAWLSESNHAGVRVLYVWDNDGKELIHIFTNTAYEKGIPDKSDAGEPIVKEECIGLPADYMPKTNDLKYSADTWLPDVKERTQAAFIAAANEDALDWSESKKENWKQLSDSEKAVLAEKYTTDLIDSILHMIGCQMMSNNHVSISTAYDHLEQFCEQMEKEKFGLDALIQTKKNTCGFEKEARKAIEDTCDAMIANTGYYGSFIINMLGQDDEFSKRELDVLQQHWAKTINTLSKMKKDAVHGHDNFCYVTNSLVDFEELTASSIVEMSYSTSKYEGLLSRSDGTSSSPWKLLNDEKQEATVPRVSSTNAGVLYLQYELQKDNKDGQDSFSKYLNSNGVGIPRNFKDKITTTYHGQRTLSLSDATWLLSYVVIGSDFKDDHWYQINNIAHSSQPFFLHDKIVHDFLDAKSGALETEQLLACRAAYNEKKTSWRHDQMVVFRSGANLDVHTDDLGRTTIGALFVDAEKYKKTITINVPVYVLTKPSEKADQEYGSSGSQDEIADTAFQKALADNKADWSALKVDNLNLYASNDKQMDEGILPMVERAVTEANKAGLDVSLSQKEKTNLAKQVKKKIFEMQAELKRNSAVRSLNVLGINGDDQAELELATRTLQGTYLNRDGNSMIPSINMDTIAEYEPFAILRFEKKNGKVCPVIDAAFEVTPLVVVWDGYLKQFQTAAVSNEDMQDMGLTMNVRLPASFIKGDTAEVIHYDNSDSLNELEQENLSIEKTNGDKYVEMSVNSCSPFSLRAADGDNGGSASGKTSTGDMISLIALILIMLVSFSTAVTLIITRKTAAK